MPPESPHQPKVKRRLKFLIVGLIAAGILSLTQAQKPRLPAIARPAVENQPGLYRVTKVDDGDTIVVAQGGIVETVRLIGIDTPEVKDPRKPVQCYGHEASNETKHLLSGKQVRLVADSIGDNRDKYHRLLRYVYLPDGTFINELLVQRGYAFAYVIFPFDKLNQFVADETSAQQAGAGLWSKCQVNSSTDIKQTNPI